MERGGYDSYGPDEALKRARERGENVVWDRLFRAAGSIGQGFWLIALVALAVAAICVTGRALAVSTPIPALAIVTIAAAGIAPLVATRLMAPYSESVFRRLLWGLTATALFLLIAHLAIAIVLFIGPLFGGVDAIAAGFHAFLGAALLALLLTIPAWALFAVWGWFRRRPVIVDRSAGPRRRILPLVIVAGTMLLLACEAGYFIAHPPLVQLATARVATLRSA